MKYLVFKKKGKVVSIAKRQDGKGRGVVVSMWVDIPDSDTTETISESEFIELGKANRELRHPSKFRSSEAQGEGRAQGQEKVKEKEKE